MAQTPSRVKENIKFFLYWELLSIDLLNNVSFVLHLIFLLLFHIDTRTYMSRST